MTKNELREHLRKVFTTVQVQDTDEKRICFDMAYLSAKDGTDEKNVQEIVSKVQYGSGLTHDFSYTIASDAVDILAELEDWDDDDAISEAVDSAVPIYYHDIQTIYQGNYGAVDEWRDETGGSTPSDSMKDAQGAWYHEIEKMVHTLRDALGDLLDEEDEEFAPV